MSSAPRLARGVADGEEFVFGEGVSHVPTLTPLMPAEAGIQRFAKNWVPAFAGTSGQYYVFRAARSLIAS